MSKKANSLEDFAGWEQTTESTSFFGEDVEVATYAPKDVLEEAKNTDLEDKSKETPNAETQQKAEEEMEFFSETPSDEEASTATLGDESNSEEEAQSSSENGEVSDKGDESGTQESVQVGYIGTLNHLKEKGLADYELEEGEEMTEEKAAEIVEDSWDNGIESRIEELFEDLPPVLKQLNQFALKGGDVNQFLSQIAQNNTQGISADMDLAVEANQELVVRDALKKDGMDDDLIASQIEFLKSSNKLEAYAKNKHSKKMEADAKANEALVKKQQDAAKARKNSLRKSKNDLTSNLKKMENIKGFQVTKQDQKELPSYMVDRSVKLPNGNFITNMQRDLMEAMQNEEKALVIAKLLRNDFDLSELQKQAETDVVKDIKNKVRRNQASPTSSGGGKNKSGKKQSLWDIMN